MITLVLTFCLISTGVCSSIKSEESFANIAACELTGQKMMAAISDELQHKDIRPAGYTCHIDPENPKG